MDQNRRYEQISLALFFMKFNHQYIKSYQVPNVLTSFVGILSLKKKKNFVPAHMLPYFHILQPTFVKNNNYNVIS